MSMLLWSNISACQSIDEVALKTWGEDKANLKIIEECVELAQVLCKKLAGAPVYEEQIVDECADVLVMTLRLRSRIGPDLVDQRMSYKIKRTLAALLRRFYKLRDRRKHCVQKIPNRLKYRLATFFEILKGGFPRAH